MALKVYNETDYLKFLTSERFEFSKSQTNVAIKNLKESHFKDSNLIKNIEQEDALLKIKYRTYSKCKRNLIIAVALIGIGFILQSIIPITFYLTLFGLVLFTSSFFGLISNRLPKLKKEYFKN